MALSPELQILIDVLHEPHRESGWDERLRDSYNDVRATINSTDATSVAIGLNEILYQRVDERIMNDVREVVMGSVNGEEFAEGIIEKSQNWGEDSLKARREVEVARNPRAVDNYFMNLDRNLAEQMQEAAVKADFSTLINVVIALLSRRDLTAGVENGAQNPDAGGASVEEDGNTVQVTQPENVITGMYLTTEGITLYEYMDKALTDANKAHGVKPYDKGVEGATSNSLDPEEMYQLFRTKIADDIANGSFPIAGLEIEDAEKIANIIKAQALDKISDAPWGKDYEGNVTYSFNPENDDLRRAIDVILSGDQSVLNNAPEVVQSNDGEHVYTSVGYAEAYYRIMNESNLGAAMTAEDMVNAFKPMLEGRYVSSLPDETNRQLAEARTLVDQYIREDGSARKMTGEVARNVENAQALLEQYSGFEGQFIQPELNIPPERHQAFFNKIREAFAESSRPGPGGTFVRDGDTFGSIMAEEFTVMEQNGVHEALRADVYDHGPEIALRLGNETETSIEVLDEQGQTAFEFPDLVTGSFSVYSINGGKNDFHPQEVLTISNIDELRKVFGDEFSMRATSIPDVDLDSTNSEFTGYHVMSKNGNSFYVGPDAAPESSTSDSFRAAREHESDTMSQPPITGADYTIGTSGAGMKR